MTGNATDVVAAAEAETRGIRTAGLLGVSVAPSPEPNRVPRKPAVVPIVASEPVRGPYTVEAIRAAKRTEETVR